MIANKTVYVRILFFLGLGVFLAPILFVVSQAFNTFEFSAFQHMLRTVLPGYLFNTFALATLSTLMALVFGAVCAFLVAFYSFPGSKIFNAALVLPLVMPPYLVALIYREFSYNSVIPDVQSLLGCALVLAATLYPYVYLFLRVTLQKQAASYIEMGYSMGLSWLQIVRRVVLPLALPALLLGALLVCIEVVSDFGVVSILGVRTLTFAAHRAWFEMYDPSLAAQLALLSSCVPLVLLCFFVLATKKKGYSNPSNNPSRPKKMNLTGGVGWGAALFCCVPVVLGFVVPLMVILGWAQEAFSYFTLKNVYSHFFQTLSVSITVALVATILGFFLALVLRSARSNMLSISSLGLVSLSYAMPAIAAGIGWLFLTSTLYQSEFGEYLSNSILLVLVALVVRFTSFALFSVESGLKGISPKIDETAISYGVGKAGGVRRVMLPMLSNSLVVGGLLVFVMAAKELTLSLVLQPFGFRTLALSIYYFADIEVFEPAAIYAICLITILVYPVLSINRWIDVRL